MQMLKNLKLYYATALLTLLLMIVPVAQAYAGPGPKIWNIENYDIYISNPASDGSRNLLFVSRKLIIPLSNDDISFPLVINKSPNFILQANADGGFIIVEQGQNIQVNTALWSSYAPTFIHADFNSDLSDDLYLQTMGDIGADIVLSSNASQLTDALFRVTRIGSDSTETDDALIRGQWSSFVRGLAANDKATTLNAFATEAQGKYSSVLDAFAGNLTAFATSINAFERVRIDEAHAVYVVTRMVGTESIAHFVTFARGENNVWYIAEL